MPTYQYACTACSEQLEAVQAFSDAPLTECPACGGKLRKVFSAVGVVFKGSGFYRNDSRGKAKSDSSSGDSTPATKADGAAAKTDSSSSSGSSSGSSSSTPASTPASTSSTPAAKTA